MIYIYDSIIHEHYKWEYAVCVTSEHLYHIANTMFPHIISDLNVNLELSHSFVIHFNFLFSDFSALIQATFL